MNRLGFSLEVGLFEHGRLIFGERKERVGCGGFGTRENNEGERDTWKLGGGLMTKHQWHVAPV